MELTIAEWTMIGLMEFCLILAILIMVWLDKYARVKWILTRINPTYAIAELDQDTTNILVKIVKTTDDKVVFEKPSEETRRYNIYPGAFKKVGGNLVIRFHHMSSEPANLRPYDAMREVWIQEQEQPKQVEEQHFDEKQKKMITTVRNVTEKVWVAVKDNIRRFEHIASPHEISSIMVQKEAWAEAQGIKLGAKRIEEIRNFVILVGIGVLIGLCIGGAVYNDMQGQKAELQTVKLYAWSAMNNTIELKNSTDFLIKNQPIRLTNTGGG